VTVSPGVKPQTRLVYRAGYLNDYKRLHMNNNDVLVVKVPSVQEAMERRFAATPFEEPYVVSEGPRLESLPVFEASEDGIHVKMEAGGVRGRLLPICARGCAKALELFILNVKRDNQISAFPKGSLQTEYSTEVTEELEEIGGFGFYAEGQRMYLHLHSVTTGRGVVFGSEAKGLELGDIEEIHTRLIRAFEALPKSCVDRSIVKVSIEPKPRKIVQAWEHGEHPADLQRAELLAHHVVPGARSRVAREPGVRQLLSAGARGLDGEERVAVPPETRDPVVTVIERDDGGGVGVALRAPGGSVASHVTRTRELGRI
jgi:hypothetical protein